MHLTRFFPDWDSLDSVRKTHSDLELAALAFFFLLVLFDVLAHIAEDNKAREQLLERIGLVFFAVAVLAEIVAYPYSQRNDALSGDQIRSLDTLVKGAKGEADDAKSKADEAKTTAAGADTLAGKAQTKADAADTTSRNALKRAFSAEQEADEVKEKLANRRLSPLQMTAIGGKLRRFNGQEYTVTAYWQSPESLDFANQIHVVLHNIAKWEYNPEGSKSQMLGGVVGVYVWTHPDADENTLAAAKSLVDALQAEGFKAEEKKQNPANPKTNIIRVNVGSKN